MSTASGTTSGRWATPKARSCCAASSLALALHQQGDEVEAIRWFERNRAACGSPGLFSEEYDVAERQLRGNLPQAFVHALLLECAARLASSWDER